MNPYPKPPARSRWRAAAIASVLTIAAAAAACDPTQILEVTDPDIIDPREVQSAAGADAVRLGALARFNTATSGAESLFLLGGLFADEWINGDSFIARQEIDQRVITFQNNFLETANRALHRARLAAEQAIDLLEEHNAAGPDWQVAEMYLVQAYTVNLMAENYCDGLVISTVVDGIEQYGEQITTIAAFEQALAHADAGLAQTFGTTSNDTRVRNALRVTRGRILLNLARYADAATSVAAVPTSFKYWMRHSSTTNSNAFWSFNNDARRYNVGNNEGINGLNFATAADPRVPVCVGGATNCITQNRRDDLTQPLYVQQLWPTRDDSVAIITGIEARLIEAEAQLRLPDPTASLNTLNALRTTMIGLAPLPDAGTPEARVNQLFRERAFWMFGTGHRVGDMRRLIRQYGRAANTVFPTGAWHKSGNYGNDVTLPIPQAEQNNPNVPAGQTCLNRNA
jgi:hypothetical protein